MKNTQPTTDLPKTQEPRALALAPCSVIWVTAIILSQRDAYKTTLSQTVSWRNNCTEDEARGAAVAYALETKPGFSIEMVTMAKIEPPSPNKEIA